CQFFSPCSPYCIFSFFFFFFLLLRLPSISTLFPYTTLFRSSCFFFWFWLNFLFFFWLGLFHFFLFHRLFITDNHRRVYILILYFRISIFKLNCRYSYGILRFKNTDIIRDRYA